jgi:6-phosphogluconate dehydrogenase
MDLVMVGLGKMGGNMARRLVAGGHRVVGFDLDQMARDEAQRHGVTPIDTLEGAVAAIGPPRVVWLMLPAGDIEC